MPSVSAVVTANVMRHAAAAVSLVVAAIEAWKKSAYTW